MGIHLGSIIKAIAESKGYSQQNLADKISLSKPGVASMYKQEGINSGILIEVSVELDYDFIAHIYENEVMKKFKEAELEIFKSEIDSLRKEKEYLEKLVSKNDQILELQIKHIAVLEEKLKQG